MNLKLSTGEVSEIDDEDYDRLCIYKWRLKGNVYRVYNPVKKSVSVALASEVMRQYDVMFDHIDRNPLNNKKSNLRPCNTSTNAMNSLKLKGVYSSDYKGVSWNTKEKRWIAMICLYTKRFYLGSFVDEAEAAKAYDAAAIKLFKEFANLNFK